MEWLDKILEIVTTPLIIGGGLSLSIGGAIALILRAILSPKKKDLATMNGKMLGLEQKQNDYATKEQYNELLELVKKQNALQKKQIANVKNVAKRQELENERLEIESTIPNKIVKEEENVVEKVEKPKKKRF